jgi:hypothetical protein
MSPDQLETREWYHARLSRHASSKTVSGRERVATVGRGDLGRHGSTTYRPVLLRFS